MYILVFCLHLYDKIFLRYDVLSLIFWLYMQYLYLNICVHNYFIFLHEMYHSKQCHNTVCWQISLSFSSDLRNCKYTIDECLPFSETGLLFKEGVCYPFLLLIFLHISYILKSASLYTLVIGGICHISLFTQWNNFSIYQF